MVGQCTIDPDDHISVVSVLYKSACMRTENVNRESAFMTSIQTGQAAGGVDSRNSTVRETMRHQESIVDGDIVRRVAPATPSRKPLVIEVRKRL